MKEMFIVILFLFSFFLVSCERQAIAPANYTFTEECERRVVAEQDPDLCLYNSDCESSCFYTCKRHGLAPVKEQSVFFMDEKNTRWCNCTCIENNRKKTIG